MYINGSGRAMGSGFHKYHCNNCNDSCHPTISALTLEKPILRSGRSGLIRQMRRLESVISNYCEPRSGEKNIAIACEMHKTFSCDTHFECTCGYQCCLKCGYKDHRETAVQISGGGEGKGKWKIMTFEEAGVTMVPVVIPVRKTLAQVIEEKSKCNSFFTDGELAWIVCQIVFGLKSAHDEGKTLGNLKTQSVLVEKDNTVFFRDQPKSTAALNPIAIETDVKDAGRIVLSLTDTGVTPSSFCRFLHELGKEMANSGTSPPPSLDEALVKLLNICSDVESVCDTLVANGIFLLIIGSLQGESTYEFFRDTWAFVICCLSSEPNAKKFAQSDLLIWACGVFHDNFLSINQCENITHLQTYQLMLWCLVKYCEILKDEESVRAVLSSNIVPQLVKVLDDYGNVLTNGESNEDFDEFACLVSMLLSRLLLCGNRSAAVDPASLQDIFGAYLPSLLELFGVLNELLSHAVAMSDTTSASAEPLTDMSAGAASSSSRYLCDVCKSEIFPQAKRFHCLVCNDFDLCGECECNEKHEKTHDLLLFPQSETSAVTVYLNRSSMSQSPPSSSLPADFFPNQYHLQTRIELAVAVACVLKGKRPELDTLGKDRHGAVMSVLAFLRGRRGLGAMPAFGNAGFASRVEAAWSGVVDAGHMVDQHARGEE